MQQIPNNRPVRRWPAPWPALLSIIFIFALAQPLLAAPGDIATVAGNGSAGFSGDGGAATSASLFNPYGVAVDGVGNLYIADRNNHRIRKMDPNGTITTVAGNGSAGFSGDGGAATSASLWFPNGVTVDGTGNLYIADTENRRIRKVTPSGIISTVAGNGSFGFSGDGGAATSASLYYSYGVTVDGAGNLYIADYNNYRIRKVNLSGIISTVAGNGVAGFSGDGGAATSASLNSLSGVTVDGVGNLYIADTNNQRIRKVNPSGIISTVAGNGVAGFSGDGGAATNASLRNPIGVTVDGAGNLYIADRDNHRIRKVNPSGIISTVTGNGSIGFSGDGGAATSARLNNPTGVVVDGARNLYIADASNQRIRKVAGVASSGTGPTLSVADANLDASSGSISVPVLFTSDGSSIASVGFSLDYQESCLSYSSVSGVPAGFIDSITHDAADTDGELDISVYDPSTPVNTLPDGTLLTVVFGVKAACITTNGTTTAVTVNFSSSPAASFGDPSANDVTGTTDGGTLTLRFNATPTDISLSPSTIAENAASGTAVGALSTTDVDAGNTHTYALVTGTGSDDNASFTIDGNSFKSAASFDFESKSSYSVRLRSTDNGGLSFEKAFTIAVTDLYEAPTGSSFGAPGGGDDGNPNTLDINENKAAGSSVATFAAANPNNGSSYTFALVAGTGDTDNGSFTFVGNELQTTAPLDAEKLGGYTILVQITDNLGNSFEQVFTITVNSVNEAPVAVDDAVDPRTTVLVGAAAHTIDVLANDSDPDVGSTLTVAALTQPAAGTATNNTSNISFSAPNANGTASFTYQATDGALNSANATVTVNYVKNDLRGDCNSNGSVTAADFTATVLELFDAGSDPQYQSNPAWWLIYNGGYAGSPLGCDANASQNGVSHNVDSVTVADIICAVRVFFGDTSCTQPVVAAANVMATATLSAPQAQAAQAGQATNVGVALDTAGNGVAAAAFALLLDPQVVSFDPTDGDGDGVPDAVTVNAPANMSRSVTWNAATHRLEVALFGVSLPLPTLADGALVTVTLNVAADAPAGSSPLTLEQVSLGDAAGADVAVTDVDGSLAIASPTTGAVKAYLPFAMR